MAGAPSQWSTKGTHRIANSAVSGWIRDFDSPVLVTLGHEAVDHNFAVDAALQRVFQAEERARVARSGLFPQFDAGQSADRSQLLGTPGQIQSRRQSRRYAFGLNMSWEIDLWKRLHDLKEVEVAVMDAQFHAYQAARLSLVANVLNAAFEVAESHEQIALGERNLRSLRTNLEILDAKLEAGDADDRTALDITLSRSDIARAESNIVTEKRQLDAAQRILETLLARYPAGVINALTRLPDPKRSIPVGLPSELLIRRPDILQAEMTVNSALYDLSATQKQLLPAIRLTGDLGSNSSDEFSQLFDLDNLIWSITQNLTQPVFQGGRIRSQIRLSEHRRDELIASYADIVLSAFREVETALAAERYFDEQVAALRINVREAKLAETLSLGNYEKGLIDIITLLESQRRSFDAQSSLLNVCACNGFSTGSTCTWPWEVISTLKAMAVARPGGG